MRERNFCPQGITLNEIEYPAHILAAAEDAVPGAEVSFEQALRASIRISIASPTKFKVFQNEQLHDGPFGALRLAVAADKIIGLLLSLQDQDPQVVSLGWNSVNAATRPEVFRDENAHAEMLALRHAGLALPIPVAALPDQNICFVEVSSSENCDACKERNRMWGSTAISMYSLLTRQVLEELGFDEGESCRGDSRESEKAHVVFGDFDRAHLETSFLYVPGMNVEAKKAFEVYTSNIRKHNGRRYQADYSEIIATQRRLLVEEVE